MITVADRHHVRAGPSVKYTSCSWPGVSVQVPVDTFPTTGASVLLETIMLEGAYFVRLFRITIWFYPFMWNCNDNWLLVPLNVNFLSIINCQTDNTRNIGDPRLGVCQTHHLHLAHVEAQEAGDQDGCVRGFITRYAIRKCGTWLKILLEYYVSHLFKYRQILLLWFL